MKRYLIVLCFAFLISSCAQEEPAPWNGPTLSQLRNQLTVEQFQKNSVLPYDMRHGVYSVSKSMIGALALFYLEKRYDEAVFEAFITDYVPALANHPAWQGVTFSHTLNMATGTEGSEAAEHLLDILDDYHAIDPRDIDNSSCYLPSLHEGCFPEFPLYHEKGSNLDYTQLAHR